MFKAGNILHGFFEKTRKNKYAIILYADESSYLITTFTTSQQRSGVTCPIHGKNPKSGTPKSYVFKAGVLIGKNINGNEFSFKKDTTIVPDYGVFGGLIEKFKIGSSDLTVVCSLYDKEYEDLIYTLYHCERLSREYKKIFEGILQNIHKE